MTVFNDEERHLARLLGSLSFSTLSSLEQSFKSEKEILGSDYIGGERALSFHPNAPNPMQNLDGLKQRARPLIYMAREKLSHGTVPIEDELVVYEELSLFVLFHRYRIQFEQVVENVLSGNLSESRLYPL